MINKSHTIPTLYAPSMLLITISVWITIRVIHALHIDVVPDTTITCAGKNVTQENLHTFLEKHELELLFGKNINDTSHFTLARLTFKSRGKRSLKNNHPTSLSLNVHNDETGTNNIHLNLRRNRRLVDDAFVYIKRFENSSVLIDDFHGLANQYADCFYRSGRSAIDVCDGALHGVVRHANRSYAIHPLPDRFGESAHIIIQTIGTASNDVSGGSALNGDPTHQRPGPHGRCASEQDAEASNLNENESLAANYGHRDRNDGPLPPPTLGHRRHNARPKRFISGTNKVPRVLHIETAIFVDKDLYRHMSKNYPKDTESRLMRFVLAMINGVQLLYHHPSLGHEINFVLKRLEILHNDPKGLQRSSDIDIFLNSFCLWQRKFNPVSDADAVHFDHAVILTGLDLYVVGKNGKISSQVVGLAPVGGMCTATSSCTINEGKHFESVFVVAHEIGHNLGMRHDTSDNDCDPSLYIMSPTLGSGKITWSKCSRKYLEDFLGTHQSKCLFDRGHFGTSLDHAAEGLLPGERFDADQQCLLKYGKNSVRSKTQGMAEICRDLHCQRDRYTWTSHPSLEGTQCGSEMWCRSGSCVSKNESMEFQPSGPALSSSNPKLSANLAESAKYANLNNNTPMDDLDPVWSDWDAASECESGCLFGESGRLREGSTGLRTISRSCLDNRSHKRCPGQDRKYESCSSKQCYNVPRTTVLDFTNQVCDRARKFDKDILADGILQTSDSPYEACKVFCRTKTGSSKTKGWIYPDGTTCRTKDSEPDDTSYCVNGKCENFTCDNSTANFYRTDAAFCQAYETAETHINSVESARDLRKHMAMRGHSEKLIDATSMNDNIESPVTRKPPSSTNNGLRRNAESYEQRRYKDYDLDNGSKYRARSNKWRVRSGCHFGCVQHSKGIQIVASKEDQSTNIQLCEPEEIACDVVQTVFQFANKLCYKYQLKVRGLSGNGMQILPSVEDPDRGCKVACQDDQLRHRFYLVNGDQGYFPFGTKCSRTDNRYCVNGKCLEFGLDNIPLRKSQISLAVYRSKRDVGLNSRPSHRTKRNYIYYSPVNITEHINPEFLRSLVDQFTFSRYNDNPIHAEHIDFLNPVNIEMDDYY